MNLIKNYSQTDLSSASEDYKNDLIIPNWDLSDFYNGIHDPKINEFLTKIKKDCEDFHNKYFQKISNLNAQEFLNAIKEFEILGESTSKLSSYGYLVYSSDLSNQEHVAFYQNTNEELSKYDAQLVFFCLEINLLAIEKFQEFFNDPLLKKYQPFLRDVSFFKKHQLSPELEKYIIQKEVTSQNAFIRLFDETINNLEFPYRDRQLNSQEIFNLLSNKDQDVRRDSAKSISLTLEKNSKLFAFITNILAKDKQLNDDYRKFSKPISLRNLSNFIEDDIVDVLVKTVKENYHNTAHRYYKLKAKMLNYQYLNYWDRNAPLHNQANQNKKKYSWIEAKNLVLQAYEEFNPKMAEIAKQFFDKNWIDAKVKSGKDSGAYSHSTVPSVHPYILMNFQGTSRCVTTLAHELGHGIHQFLARKQGYLQCSTPLTLAETASVFGEQLVFQKILEQEKNPEVKKIIIAEKIEDMINTVIRQISFLEFEKKIHDERKNGEIPLEKINQFWLDVQTQSLGDAFRIDSDYRFYWSYISHFIHAPFYVYSYAFGDCLVNSLYNIYKSQQITNFSDKYINMLELGGVDHHKEMLSPFGIDISKNQFWQSGIDVIVDFINQLEKLLEC